MIADEFMTRQPITVSEDTSIGDALAILSEERIRHLPVVRGGEVVGILSDRDFRSLGVSLVNDEQALDLLRAQLSRPVSVLMTGGVVTVGRDAEASEIAEVMLEEKLSAVPVVEPGTQELAGIVSYLDLLRVTMPLLQEA